MSVWMKVRNAHCSYWQFFIVFSLLVVVKVKLQKVAFYRGAMVLLLQDYALQIRRLQPSHAAMLAPRGPRLPDHMAATLPTDQITQIRCAKTTLLATSFHRGHWGSRSSKNIFTVKLLWGPWRFFTLSAWGCVVFRTRHSSDAWRCFIFLQV